MKSNKSLCNTLLFMILPFICFSQKVPGEIVCYEPASSQKYIGSPSLVVMPNGDYIAAHDFFGPESSEWQQAVSRIYISKDKGVKWQLQSTVYGAFWSSLFVHRGTLYFLGPDRHHGTVLIRKSTDEGKTWTQPTNKDNGVLLTGEFHCAPMPIIEYNGRLWRPMETAHGPIRQWGKRYGAMVMSAAIDADLLKAESWRASDPVYYDETYLQGNFGGWLEGNFVIDRENRMWDMLRVDDKTSQNEKAAMVQILENGKEMNFEPATGFIDFPGGSKKFVVKYDPKSNAYWTLVNVVSDEVKKKYPSRNSATTRNTLMLRKSHDLLNWEDVQIILAHEDVLYHGFQYVDWSFEENDIILLSRTAYFDGENNAHNNHDANYLTFHRISNFRDL